MRRLLPAVAATLLIAGALAVPSLAHDDRSTESSGTQMIERAQRQADMRARHNELLAGELGVTVEDLEAAQDRVREVLKAERREELVAHLDEKVADGTITQERADAMLERFDGDEGLRGPGRGGPAGGGPAFGGPRDGGPRDGGPREGRFRGDHHHHDAADA